jgi:hypothetical protein
MAFNVVGLVKILGIVAEEYARTKDVSVLKRFFPYLLLKAYEAEEISIGRVRDILKLLNMAGSLEDIIKEETP